MKLTRFWTLLLGTMLVSQILRAADSPSSSTSDPAEKHVLLLGDSISIGYTPFVRQLLQGEAVVVRPMAGPNRPENCDGTTKGVQAVDRWLRLDGGHWDVIHFNFGLHDLKRVNPQTGAASNNPNDPRQASPAVYEQQLRAIVAKLKATGAKLVYATTTPVPKGDLKPHRDVEDVARYNQIALRVMRENDVAIDDLFSLALPQLNRIQRPANVHFTEDGYKLLAAEVARQIRLALGRSVAAPAQRTDRRPNVIFIMTDDQGTIDANCYGATDLCTPAIDELAFEGVRFTQFYSAAPVCSPSRAGLMTGRDPLRAGLTGNASSTEGQAGGLPSAQVTMAETFHAAGYVTAHIGKWHLGYTPDTMPNAQGFDYSFGHMGGCIDNFSHFFYWAGPNRHDLWRNGKEVYEPGRFFPDLMVEEASRFMETNQDRPFFLYFAMNTPHYPYQGEPCWLEHYKHLSYPRNLYAAFVSTLDGRIRRLLAKVDELGLRGNTIIAYQSDNGYSTEERAHFGGGNAGPYRGAKFSLFEGGMRVPAIISWPGHLPEHAVRTQMGHGCDWLPTLTELCGVPLLNRDIDGKSLDAVIRSSTAPSPHEVLFWQVGGGRNPQWAVRQGDWKLIGNAWDTSPGKRQPHLPLFLSNLAQDAGERTDQAKAHPEVVQRLLQLPRELAEERENSEPAVGSMMRRKAFTPVEHFLV